MYRLSVRIMEHAEALPEATPLRPTDFLHFGSRPAVVSVTDAPTIPGGR